MKVEEFNVSIHQFVQNIQTDYDLMNIITSLELLLIEKLEFHLTIHNFYRPFEGFLLDIKVSWALLRLCTQLRTDVYFKAHYPELNNADILRQAAFDFLDKILNTDAILLYPPSQVCYLWIL